MRPFRTIRARFTGWYLVILALLLIGLSVGLYSYLSFTLRRNLDRVLVDRVAQLAGTPNIVQITADGRFEGMLGEIIAFYTVSEGTDAYDVVSNRLLGATLDDSVIARAFAGTPSHATLSSPDGQALRFYVSLLLPPAVPPGRVPIPTPVPSGAPERASAGPVVAVVAQPLDGIRSALSALGTTLLVAVPLTLLLSAGGGLFLVRRALRPVDRMIASARTIEETDLARRLDATSNDELGRLGETLNGMLHRLEHAFRRQRQFTDDASHELRSPLSVIEAEATLALRRERSADDYREALATIADEAAGMNRLIDQLLTLARADASREPSVFESVDLGALAADTVTALTPLAEEKGIDLRLDSVSTAGTSIAGLPDQIRRVITNLIDNAIRYTDPAGSIAVSIDTTTDLVRLRVRDTGAGIAPTDVPHVFNRFHRADKTRGRNHGSGLGLAICRDLVSAHGGSIDVDSELGRGSTFTVSFPRP